MQTSRNSAPVSPTGSTTLQGSEWPGLGSHWPWAGLQAWTLGAQDPHRANLRNLGQSLAEWVRRRVWRQQTAAQSLQLSPSHEADDIKWLNLSCFISKQGQWQPIHTFRETKPPVCSVNVSPLPYSSLTMISPVLWTRDRKVPRGHSGDWVCDQNQDSGM